MRIHFVLPAVAAPAAAGGSLTALSAAASTPTPSSSTTVKQLEIGAAGTESAACLQYFAYADGAAYSGRTDLTDVWQTVGQVKHQDHWTNEVKPAGLYSGSDDAANLVGRETADAKLLTRALAAEQSKGSMPLAPGVQNVPIQVATAPHCLKTFYNDLTSGSNSALEPAVWNWAEYQYDTRTAVDTGQADLVALFYSDYATKAQNAGDASTASLLRGIGDETGHNQTFSAEFQQLDSGK